MGENVHYGVDKKAIAFSPGCAAALLSPSNLAHTDVRYDAFCTGQENNLFTFVETALEKRIRAILLVIPRLEALYAM